MIFKVMFTGFAVQEYPRDSVGQIWSAILGNTFESIDTFVHYGLILMLPLLIFSTWLSK